VSAYLDASAVLPLFLAEVFTARSEEALAQEAALVLSDWTVVEVSGVIVRQARTGAISNEEARESLTAFDHWRAGVAGAETTAEDMQASIELVRRSDLALRGPDALHIAIARRLAATLVTFDSRMAAAASRLGLEVRP
jgi:hypothetical protein